MGGKELLLAFIILLYVVIALSFLMAGLIEAPDASGQRQKFYIRLAKYALIWPIGLILALSALERR